jgi:hypothetical protein
MSVVGHERRLDFVVEENAKKHLQVSLVNIRVIASPELRQTLLALYLYYRKITLLGKSGKDLL